MYSIGIATNAPAIFGEVFQLLDRKAEPDESGYPVGTSEYGITNETNSFISLEQLIREFMDRRGNDRFRIFKEGMFNAIVDQVDGTTIQ